LKTTRRKFLKAVGAGAAWLALSTTTLPGCEPARRTRKSGSPERPKRAQTGRPPPSHPEQTRSFRSRPDLSPPTIDVLIQPHNSNSAPGYIFVAPKNGPGEASPAQDGSLIVDNSGEPVWFRPLRREEEDVMDFKVQYYRGEPVLTWWEGVHTGYGQGEYVIADGSYREIRRVRAGNGYRGDHHEFLISPENTALLDIYGKVESVDLSSVGGPKEGRVLEGVVQEVDIQSGEVLFEWHSLEHVGLEEAYAEPPKDPRWSFDYFHINSIDVDHDSNLLVSARRTSAVYKIERKSGEVIWRLGGKKSDFEMGPGTSFAWQHDARRQSDGTITIFDNGGVKKDKQSYGLVLELDEEEMSATLVRKYPHPERRLAGTQGSVQVLPNGNVFIGWGSNPLFSEFSRGGELLFNASFPPEVESYRAFRFPWSSAHPSEEPAVVAETGPDDEVTVYTSWNGATEVASWQVLAGPDRRLMRSVGGGGAPREGFETAITVHTAEPYVSVQAKDRSGRVLATSKAVKPETR
jgi:hypothetical protein